MIEFNVAKAVSEAHAFFNVFCQEYDFSNQSIQCKKQPLWARQLVNKSGLVMALVEKIGSNSFVKRRPEDKTSFIEYIKRCVDSQKIIQFRIPIGPVKNMNLSGEDQYPDIAEYLMFIQLARFAAAVSAIYPFGIRIELVPDDVRAKAANDCPDHYVRSYVDTMRRMVVSMGFQEWLHVETGQMRLCEMYKVSQYREEAEKKLIELRDKNDLNFSQRWINALENAKKNFVVKDHANAEKEIAAAAWRYLVAHQSEILSGMWYPIDAFPMVYAHHPHNYQLFSMGAKQTKLPWQVVVPIDSIESLENNDGFCVKKLIINARLPAEISVSRPIDR